MTLPDKKVISILEDLVEICKDGEQGFKDAADDTKEEELSKTLLGYSLQREQFMIELNNVIKLLGGEVEFSGSIFGVLHRRWMDVRFGIAGSNSESILKECVRGESAALKKYKMALSAGLPEEILNIVNRQYIDIQRVYDSIKGLLEYHENKVLES
jgi:uncharacterized protein (TIGR02284 family)